MLTETKPYPTRRGVRKIDTISAKLSITVLEDVSKRRNSEQKGIAINGEKLNRLRFVD